MLNIFYIIEQFNYDENVTAKIYFLKSNNIYHQ